jgi:hypothetical protein
MSDGTTQEQRSPEQIRADIERTRRDLGDTAAALAQKADVKARAHDKVEGVKQSLTLVPATDHVKRHPLPSAAIGAFVIGFALGRLTAR